MESFFAWILDKVLSFIIFIIKLLPDLAWVQLESFDGMIELVSMTSCFMPWSTFFIALGIWIMFQQVRFVMTIVNWIIGKIPFIN